MDFVLLIPNPPLDATQVALCLLHDDKQLMPLIFPPLLAALASFYTEALNFNKLSVDVFVF